jgi:two-component system NtrC family sensor kinase
MSSIPANRQSRRRTARRTTTATLAWLRGNGVALTVLAGLLLIGSLALTQSGVAILAFARFGDAFKQVANTDLPNLLAASRLSELSQSLVARAPELAASGSQTQRQGIADRLNERLAALAQVLDRIDRTAINPGQLQNVRSQRDALATNLRALDDFVRQRIDADSALATVMARLPVLAARVRQVADEALIAGGDGDRGAEAAATSIERPGLIAWSAAGLEGITLMLGTPAAETKSRLERIRVEFETLVSRMEVVRSRLSAQMRQKIDAMDDDIVQFGSGDQGIFQARQAQIEAGTAIQTSLRLIDQNIDKFLASVSTILGATQREISGRSANLNQTISHFNLLIIVTSLLCVLAGAAIFAYVRHAVITRLKRVQGYMRAQVEGRPAEMSTKGADEIAEIATATRVFVTRIATREAALQQRTVELSTALEQQTATAEVLQVINSSPGDLAPVFDAMLEKASRLCQADSGFVFQLQDGLRMVAAFGVPAEYRDFQTRNPIPLGRGTLAGRTALERRAVHIKDAAADSEYTRAEAIQLGLQRTMLGVPLIREDALIGVITFGRSRVEPFTEKQIALVTTVADQAVIAIENARLLTETREALAQQTATAEVLQVITSSLGDLAPVFDAMLEKAMRLCEAAFGELETYDGERFHSAAMRGLPGPYAEFRTSRTHIYGPGTVPARFLAGEHLIHVADVKAEKAYLDGERNRRALVELGGARTVMAVPLLKEDTLLGFIIIYRQEVRPFSDKQIALLGNFASQAVIAMENARLLSEIRQRQAELRVTIDNMGDGVAMFDADLRLAAWNRNFQQIIDLPDAFLAVRPGYAEYFRYLADRGEYPADLEAELSRGLADSRQELSFERTRPDGRVLEVRRNAVPGGGFVLIYGDITERKRAEEQIRDARDAAEKALGDLRATQQQLVLQQKMAALGQLTAGIAHEIKNPLNFVNNFAGLSVELLDELKEAATPAVASASDDARAEIDEIVRMLTGNLEKIAEHGKRADGIVTSMLEHSRGSSSDRRTVDLNNLVEEALNLAYHGRRAQDQSFNVTLERDYGVGVAPIELVPQEITRVCLNLIGNGFYAASKRQREGGGAEFRATLKVSTRDLGAAVEIHIRDNGVGIAPELRDRLFQPFFTTKPTGEGTGLGLSISYDIVTQQHGGTIDVDSKVDDFTEFTIRLPRTHRIAAEAAS